MRKKGAPVRMGWPLRVQEGWINGWNETRRSASRTVTVYCPVGRDTRWRRWPAAVAIIFCFLFAYD